VQTLVGSIGLIASVPLTTALACWVVTRSADEEPEPDVPPVRRPNRGGASRGPGLDRPATRRPEAVVPAWQPPPPPQQWAPQRSGAPGGGQAAAQDPRPSESWVPQRPGPGQPQRPRTGQVPRHRPPTASEPEQPERPRWP